MIDGMEMCASFFYILQESVLGHRSQPTQATLRIEGASVLLHGVAFAIHTYA